jgi:hypothetical protein
VRNTFRVVAVGVLALLLAAGCADDSKSAPDTASTAGDRPTVEVTAQPQDADSAQVAVEQLFSLIATADWSSVWDLWTVEAQAQVPRQAFVDLIATCPDPGQSYKVTSVRSVDPATVTFTWSRDDDTAGTANGTTTMHYEQGSWRVMPDAATLTAYKNHTCG